MARRTPSAAEVLGLIVEPEGERFCCRIWGELDSTSASRLRGALGEHMDRDVVVDLSDLVFIDSSGIGVLVGALKRFEASGHRLTLRRPTSAIQRVFVVTGLDRAFVIED